MTTHPDIARLPPTYQAFIERWWRGRATGLFQGDAQKRIGLISRELAKQTDRGAAIIGAAILEDRLKETLFARLVPGFQTKRFPIRRLGGLIPAC